MKRKFKIESQKQRNRRTTRQEPKQAYVIVTDNKKGKRKAIEIVELESTSNKNNAELDNLPEKETNAQISSRGMVKEW